MLKSLSFDCCRVDEPAATDPLERRTWASVRILVEHRCVTSFWNRLSNETAEFLYLPTFPLAEWLVTNWWQLLFEPCRREAPLRRPSSWTAEDRDWVHRHCVRAAESGLFLPALFIYSEGEKISLDWFPDEQDSYPSMPGFFLYRGNAVLDVEQTRMGLGEFVGKVLGWCEGLSDPRIETLRQNWTAISNADSQESAFCRGAARMGLDPYAVNDWEPGVEELLTSDLGDRIGSPLVEDLLESTTPEFANAQWHWVSMTEQSFRLQAGVVPQIDDQRSFREPKDQGYFAARQLRGAVGLSPDQAVDDVSVLTIPLHNGPLKVAEHNQIPGKNILAAVGWTGTQPVVASPKRPRPEVQRFLEARALYLALNRCKHGPRLVTSAHTRDQQAARAFAAELLAPQAALASRVDPMLGLEERPDVAASLAAEFQVSPSVIHHQLQNCGLWGSSAL